MSDFNTLVCLADNLYSRFEGQGNPSDLSLCIVHYRSALTLARSSVSLSSDAQSKLFSNLANALSIRFQRHGDVADLDHSVECHLAALDLRPPGHPGRAKTLSNFATVLLIRYGQLGVQKDIELAIEHFNAALSVLPPGGRLIPLMNYASALLSRFQRVGDVVDLNNAIRQYRVAVDSPLAENKSTSCYNLANALLSRFKLDSDPKDLELSIEYSSVALQGMDGDHPDRLLALSCLSNALIKRFELCGDAEDLETAVKNFKYALELRSAEDAPQPVAYFDLADALVIRYKLRCNLPDLELAIKHYRMALDVLASNHENEGIFLDNLGNALFLRFSSSGSLDDLEEAIRKFSLALDVRSEESPRRITTLGALGACLDVRFEQVGNPEDLHTAISLYDKALTDAPQDHPDRATILERGASGLEMRFRICGEIDDLDRSISYSREALELLAPDHPDRSRSYQALASALLLRFEETGDEFDLDEAYLACSSSIRYTADPSRVACNLLLARIAKARVLPWEAKDVEPIFHHLRIAKDHCTLTNPLVSDVYAELASTHYLRFLREQKPSDLHEAFGLHELSMNIVGGSLWPALRAALQWVKDAEIYDHRSGADVYRCALRLVDRHVLALRSPELRQCFARRFCPSLACDGASFALRFQSPAEAVETLERGRSVLWTQLVLAKTCLDDLRLTGEYGASLADEFERLSVQLERLSSASEFSKDVKPLLKEKEAVVSQIRRIDGFKLFLKSAPFSDLEKAAIDGPVILLNASRHSCDALILLHNVSPIHVPLSDTTPYDLVLMAARFQELTGDLATSENEDALERLLSELWDVVVSPVVQQVPPHAPRGSRLWWCPTGVFTSLPLHAAGPYGQDAPPVSQLYVCSYTPTLQALIRARRTHDTPRPRRTGISLPAFLNKHKNKSRGQPHSCSGPSAASHPTATTTVTPPTIIAVGRAAPDEICHALELLRNRIPPSVPFRRLEGDDVRAEDVLAACRCAGPTVWLHLACPASLDARAPCRSGFALRDGVLAVRDVAVAARPHAPVAEFAFLSGRWRPAAGGRRGAGGAEGTEETMHLAAALQYAGVRSVVGTLWPVEDEAMECVTAAFYERVLLKAAGSMHHTNTAQSLHEALAAVGEGLPLAQRIAFVHVGA